MKHKTCSKNTLIFFQAQVFLEKELKVTLVVIVTHNLNTDVSDILRYQFLFKHDKQNYQS